MEELRSDSPRHDARNISAIVGHNPSGLRRFRAILRTEVFLFDALRTPRRVQLTHRCRFIRNINYLNVDLQCHDRANLNAS